jgi:hypothetical protein
MPDNNFIVVSCENHFCEQYNKIKVLKIPRLDVKTAKFEL